MGRIYTADVLEVNGKEHEETLRAANNYAWGLCKVSSTSKKPRHCCANDTGGATRSRERVAISRSSMRWVYAQALYHDDSATLDDLREAVTTLEDAEPIARRVLGGAHPTQRWD